MSGKSRHFKEDPVCLFSAQEWADLQAGANNERDVVSKFVRKNKLNERK